MSDGDSAAATPTERANLWCVCAAQFITLAGMTAVLPLLPLYLHQIGVSDPATLRYWTGALGSAPFAVAVFATPIWGSLADRVGHKPMVVRSVFGIALATFGMGLAETPAQILGWRGLQGAVSGVFPAAVALLSALTPEPRAGRALAWLQSARAGGSLCGPLLGGVVADLVGVRPLFFVFGTISALAGIMCSRILRESHRPPTAESSGVPRETSRELLAGAPMRGMLVVIVLFQIVTMSSWPTLALFVQQFGVAESTIGTTTGLVVLAAGLPATLAATAWTRLATRIGSERALIAALLLVGIANVATGMVESLAAVFPLRALAGLSTAGFVPLAFDWMNRQSPSQARGRVAGFGSTAMMLGNVLGPLLGGWLAVHVGLGATFWVPGAGIATLALAMACMVRMARRA